MAQPPVILLCAPRSFFSVAVSMLGQHPELYAFPELNLFLTDTIGELLMLQRDVAPGAGDSALGSTSRILRAVARLQFGEQNPDTIAQALKWLEEHAGWSTRWLFEHLLELVSPRVGMEKSVRCALSNLSIGRVQRYYPNGRSFI